jgi:hypothetical protein
LLFAEFQGSTIGFQEATKAKFCLKCEKSGLMHSAPEEEHARSEERREKPP